MAAQTAKIQNLRCVVDILSASGRLGSFVLATVCCSNGACRKALPADTGNGRAVGVLVRLHDAACDRVLPAGRILVSNSRHRSQLRLPLRRRVRLAIHRVTVT